MKSISSAGMEPSVIAHGPRRDDQHRKSISDRNACRKARGRAWALTLASASSKKGNGSSDGRTRGAYAHAQPREPDSARVFRGTRLHGSPSHTSSSKRETHSFSAKPVMKIPDGQKVNKVMATNAARRPASRATRSLNTSTDSAKQTRLIAAGAHHAPLVSQKAPVNRNRNA